MEHRDLVGGEMVRRAARVLALVSILVVGVCSAPAMAGASSGSVISVRGVVVHRAPLLGRYTIIGPRGHLLAIHSDARIPALAHRVRVRIREVGDTFRQIGFRVGPVDRVVELSGVVSYVAPRAHRFTLSDGYSSILVLHRLSTPLPKLYDHVALRALIGPRGRLVEEALLDQGHSHEAVRFSGFVKYLIPPTGDSLSTPTELVPAGSCIAGCVVLSADEAGESSADELIPVPLPPASATASAASTTATTSKKKKKKRKEERRRTVEQELQNKISSEPSKLVDVSVTLPEPAEPAPTPVIVSSGTIVITGTITIEGPPATPTAPVVLPPPPACGAGYSPVVIPGATGPACASDCPFGAQAFEASPGSYSCLSFEPIQVVVTKPSNVCTESGSFFEEVANGIQCAGEEEGGANLLL